VIPQVTRAISEHIRGESLIIMCYANAHYMVHYTFNKKNYNKSIVTLCMK